MSSPTILSACNCTFTLAGKTMKTLRQLFVSVVLTLLLSISVFGGEGIIHTVKTDPPPPSPPAMATSNEAEGIITTWRTAIDPVTEVALNLLPGVLALF
jgi:hypothetical protein